jgi:hypothetical protein
VSGMVSSGLKTISSMVRGDDAAEPAPGKGRSGCLELVLSFQDWCLIVSLAPLFPGILLFFLRVG